MQDLFSARSARPMLIGASGEPYDDADSLFELKLDGERCLAYLDKTGVVLVNRRGVPLLSRLPELSGIHRQVSARCVLDGELITGVGSAEDFEDIRARLAHQSVARVSPGAVRHPASFVAFDILYLGDREVTARPLEERKALLAGTLRDGAHMALARTVDGAGRALYDLVLQQGLEGVVGKKKQSLYYPGKRTKEWVKVKHLQEDDFVIGGYIPAEHVAMLVLGQYGEGGGLEYRGRVTLGLRSADFHAVRQAARAPYSPFAQLPSGAVKPAEPVVWLRPALVCTVSYVCRTADGLMRQPHYRALRPDKAPQEAVDLGAQARPEG